MDNEIPQSTFDQYVALGKELDRAKDALLDATTLRQKREIKAAIERIVQERRTLVGAS